MNYYSQFKVQLVVWSLETTLEIVTYLVTSTGNSTYSTIEQKPHHIMGVFKLECHNPGPPPKILGRRDLLATGTLRKI